MGSGSGCTGPCANGGAHGCVSRPCASTCANGCHDSDPSAAATTAASPSSSSAKPCACAPVAVPSAAATTTAASEASASTPGRAPASRVATTLQRLARQALPATAASWRPRRRSGAATDCGRPAAGGFDRADRCVCAGLRTQTVALTTQKPPLKPTSRRSRLQGPSPPAPHAAAPTCRPAATPTSAHRSLAGPPFAIGHAAPRAAVAGAARAVQGWLSPAAAAASSWRERATSWHLASCCTSAAFSAASSAERRASRLAASAASGLPEASGHESMARCLRHCAALPSLCLCCHLYLCPLPVTACVSKSHAALGLQHYACFGPRLPAAASLPAREAGASGRVECAPPRLRRAFRRRSAPQAQAACCECCPVTRSSDACHAGHAGSHCRLCAAAPAQQQDGACSALELQPRSHRLCTSLRQRSRLRCKAGLAPQPVWPLTRRDRSSAQCHGSCPQRQQRRRRSSQQAACAHRRLQTVHIQRHDVSALQKYD